MGKIIGTDGVRAVAGESPMSCSKIVQIAQAFAIILKEEKPRMGKRHRVLVAKDTRISGYMVENAITAGLCSQGVDVILTGPLPTPGASFVMKSMRCDGAIMITASHNEFFYNGIKFFDAEGYKLASHLQDRIDQLVSSGEIEKYPNVTNEHIGRAKRIDDVAGRYLQFAKQTFVPDTLSLEGLSIVLDCANGATYKIAPMVMAELGARVICIACDPNGININDQCGSTDPESMRSMVIKERAHVGIAFDGDGDRLIMCDEDGRIIDGNGLLAILAMDRLMNGNLTGNGIATNIVANLGLIKLMEDHGARVVLTKVGDSPVAEAMRQHGFTLGGEDSGHILILDHNVTGDALIAALQVLAIMKRGKTPLSKLASVYTPMPESKANIANKGKKLDHQLFTNLQEKWQQHLGQDGRVIIRPSGTEPVTRIVVQHLNQKTAEHILNQIVEEVKKLYV